MQVERVVDSEVAEDQGPGEPGGAARDDGAGNADGRQAEKLSVLEHLAIPRLVAQQQPAVIQAEGEECHVAEYEQAVEDKEGNQQRRGKNRQARGRRSVNEPTFRRRNSARHCGRKTKRADHVCNIRSCKGGVSPVSVSRPVSGPPERQEARER